MCIVLNTEEYVEGTFGATYPHNSLKADFSCQISLEVFLETFSLRGVVMVVIRGVVMDAAS